MLVLPTRRKLITGGAALAAMAALGEQPAYALPVLIANTVFTGGSNGGTTGSVNTTGATGLFVITGAYAGAASNEAVTDNKGNTFTQRAVLQTSPTQYELSLWDCISSPTVGPGHTFSQGSYSYYNTICAAAFSGTTTYGSSVTAQIASGTSTEQAGSLTPGGSALCISGLLFNNSMTGTASIDSSFSITNQTPSVASTCQGSALAWLASSSAFNPTWSGQATGASETAVLNAWYNATGGGGGGTTNHSLGMLGVGQ